MIEISPGIPLFYFLMALGAVIAVIGSLVTYRFIQVRSIPRFVKKSKELIKTIKKQKKIPESLMYPSKEEQIAKMFGRHWKFHGLSSSESLGLGTGKSMKPKQSDQAKRNIGGEK